MNTVFITDTKQIGGNNPCFIIAEIGQNHQGDIEIAKKLIKAAKVGYFYRKQCYLPLFGKVRKFKKLKLP